MKELTAKSFELRETVLEIIKRAGAGHIGGDFSVMDILVALYFGQMNVSPENQDDPDRDLLVLSKGHSVEAYYAVLAEKGFFPAERLLNEYSAFGSPFIGHPNNELPGVEMNSGSLGHGLPVGVGMALACRMDGRENRVYVVMGDGELAEGSVWEGFMAGGHFALANLCAVIDRNGLQISGATEDVMAHGDLAARIRSFGWNVIEVNGNSIPELCTAFEAAKRTADRPTCVIANTVKGFGGGEIMESRASWHHHVPTDEEYAAIKEELRRRREAASHE